MSVLRALLAGCRRARRAWRLAALMWAANLGLALLLAVPAWRGLDAALGHAPEGDRLLDGFSLPLLAALLRDHEDSAALWMSMAAGLALVAFLVNALMAGGTLQVLSRPGARFLESFGQGAGRHFGRFLRLAAWTGLGFGTSAVLPIVAVKALQHRFEDSPWEPMPLVLSAGGALALGLLAVVWLVALDLARLRVAAQNSQRVRPALRSSLRQVLSGLAPLGAWSAYGLACLGLLAAYAAFRNVVPTGNWPGIALMVLVQQAVMLARTGLRLSLWGAFFELQPPLPVDPAATGSSNV